MNDRRIHDTLEMSQRLDPPILESGEHQRLLAIDLASAQGAEAPSSASEVDERTGKGARRALWGFYLYSWAVEVYAIVSLTLFLPITLEQYARESGKLAADHSRSCDEDALAPCDVHLLWFWMNTASYSLYTYSASVALQAVTVISISKSANDPVKRKRLLAFFTLSGGFACLLFAVIPSRTLFWPVSSILTIAGNVAFGAALVCLNAYIPFLARLQVALDWHHGLKIKRDESRPPSSSSIQSVEPSMDGRGSAGPSEASAAEMSSATSMVSSRGIAAGYGAGILLLSLMLIPVTLMKGSLASLRTAVVVSGLWWLLFAIPAFVWLPVPASHQPKQAVDNASTRQAWRELLVLLRAHRQLPETFKYLLAWFIMSDAFATITSTAILFAKGTLGMPASSLVLVGVLTPVFGILGAVGWPIVQRKFLRSSNLATLQIIVALAILVPLYGLAALTTPLELFIVSCYFGALYGALQSYARAVFSSIIPAHEAARFFALYSITDKSSSFIGPALVAAIADATGSIRAGFTFVLVALILPLPVLAWVDVDRGTEDAARYQIQSMPATENTDRS